jgi:serine/threonine protein kinase
MEKALPRMQEISQLYKIFQVLGTPDNSTWPGVSELPDYMPTFPRWRAVDLHGLLRHKLEPDGLDLLVRMLRYAPSERLCAAEALRHPYFADLADYQPGTRLPIG